jgi:hypothetical protein
MLNNSEKVGMIELRFSAGRSSIFSTISGEFNPRNIDYRTDSRRTVLPVMLRTVLPVMLRTALPVMLRTVLPVM